MNKPIPLEMCLESVESAIAAERGGADRIELCANLLEGGTTPSAGTIAAARGRLKIAIQVMVRPRGGDFLYTEAEFEAMQHDISVAKNLGADGIVFGLLHADGTVDRERAARLVEQAAPLPVTFHRAIDVTRDLMEALEAVIASGCARVLTSGGEPSVLDGAEMAAKMVRAAGERILVMPGCGVTTENVWSILAQTGAREIHVALETPQPSGMVYRKPEIPMGGVAGREYLRFLTEEQAVAQLVRAIRG